MRILAIGDLHGKFPENLPKEDIDIILLTGDIGKSDFIRKQSFKRIENPNYKPTSNAVKVGYTQSYNSTLKVLERLRRIAQVYLVYGNVESSDSETREISKEIGFRLPVLGKTIRGFGGIQNIGGRIRTLGGFTIAGYDYFCEKSWVRVFNLGNKERLKECAEEDKKARDFFDSLPRVDILLTHQPPYGILDKVTAEFAPKDWKGKHAGSKIILDYIKRHQPRYVICGHIHEGEGERRIGKTRIINLGIGNYRLLEI